MGARPQPRQPVTPPAGAAAPRGRSSPRLGGLTGHVPRPQERLSGWEQTWLFLWDFHLQGLSLLILSPGWSVTRDMDCGHHRPRSEPTSGRNSAYMALGGVLEPTAAQNASLGPTGQAVTLTRGCRGVGVACLLLPEAGGGFAPGPLQPQAPASSTLGVSSGLSSLSLTLLPLLMNLRNPHNPRYRLNQDP